MLFLELGTVHSLADVDKHERMPSSRRKTWVIRVSHAYISSIIVIGPFTRLIAGDLLDIYVCHINQTYQQRIIQLTSDLIIRSRVADTALYVSVLVALTYVQFRSGKRLRPKIADLDIAFRRRNG